MEPLKIKKKFQIKFLVRQRFLLHLWVHCTVQFIFLLPHWTSPPPPPSHLWALQTRRKAAALPHADPLLPSSHHLQRLCEGLRLHRRRFLCCDWRADRLATWRNKCRENQGEKIHRWCTEQHFLADSIFGCRCCVSPSRVSATSFTAQIFWRDFWLW